MPVATNARAGSSPLRSIFESAPRLRFALTVVFMLAWYVGIYVPLSGKIADRTNLIKTERDRLELAKLVDHLRQESARVSARIPEDSDGNEWIAFFMNQVRKYPLRLVSLDPKAPTDIGPYKVVSFRVTVEGRYDELEKLLRTIETSPRLLRIELIKLGTKLEESSSKAKASTQNIELQLNILGVTNNQDREKPERKGSGSRT